MDQLISSNDDSDPKESYKHAFNSIYPGMFHWELAKLLSSIYFNDFIAFNEYLISALKNDRLPEFLHYLFDLLLKKEFYEYYLLLFSLSSEVIPAKTRLKWISSLLEKQRYQECMALLNLPNTLINQPMRELVGKALFDLQNSDQQMIRIDNMTQQTPVRSSSTASCSSSDTNTLTANRLSNYHQLIDFLSKKAFSCTSQSASYRNLACFVWADRMNDKGFNPLRDVLAFGNNEPNTKIDSSAAKHAEANTISNFLHSKAIMKQFSGGLLLFSVRFRPNSQGEFVVSAGGEMCEKCQKTIAKFNRKMEFLELAINRVAWVADKDSTIIEKSAQEFIAEHSAPISGGDAIFSARN